MKRFLVLLTFLAGAGMLGWAGYDYSRSGTEIYRTDLSGEEGAARPPALNPGMNPMRAILQAEYEIEIKGGESTAFDYSFKLEGPSGQPLFDIQAKQRDGVQERSASFESKDLNQVLATFSVTESGDYVIPWTVTPQEARISRLTLSLRQNVRPLQTGYIIGGAFCVVLGLMILLWRRRRHS